MKNLYFLFLGIMLTFGLSARPGFRPSQKAVPEKDTKSRHETRLGFVINDLRNQHKMLVVHPPFVAQPDLKSAAVKQKLDSLVTQEYDTLNLSWKTTMVDKFTYNAQGKNTSYISYDWSDVTNKIEPEYKYEYAYNSNGLLAEYHSFDWDTLNTVAQWVETMKYIDTYNSNGQVTEDIYYYRDDDVNQLLPSSKTTYTYDAAGNQVTEISYMWDDETNNWALYSKIENTYDSNGNLLTMENSIYMGESTWMLYMKEVNTYDSQGRPTQGISSRFNYATYSLGNTDKVVYTYNSSGENTLVVNYKWELGAWVNYSKDENTFDSSHRTLTSKTSRWDETGNVWKAEYMDENSYDANGNFNLSVYWEGDEAGNLVKVGKDEVTYNNSYSVSDIIYPNVYGYFLESITTHMITGIHSFDWVNGTWRYDSKSLFNYSGINVTTANIFGDGSIRVFPNPASDKINIFTGSELLSQVSLFGLDGNLILTRQFSGQVSVQTGHLPTGIYLLKIQSPGEPEYQGKIVIQ